MIDANLNRASEALRVLEDAARFALEDGALGARLKAIRHEIREATAVIPASRLRRGRDVEGDPGRKAKVAGEERRRDWAEVAAVAGSRLAEALRSLEELLKIDHPAAAARIERCRYESYELAARVERSLLGRRRRQWRLCVLLTIDACRGSWSQVLDAALRGGADCVQVREKHLADRELLAHARRVIDLARPRGASIVINDRVDLALAVGADGVHLGQDDLPLRAARRLAGPDLLLGASTHDLGEVERALADGADMLGVGCIHPSSTKRELSVAGLELLRAFASRHADHPHLAIGGIDPSNATATAAAGARGFAVGRAITAAEDPEGAAARLVEAIESVDRPAPAVVG